MKKVIRIILVVLLVFIIFGTFYFLWSKSKKKELEYETVKIERRDIEKVTVLTGTVEPRDEVQIKPQISGIITEIYKEAGDIVKAGDIIAKVQVVPDIAQLNSAESQLKLAEIALNKAKTDHERSKRLFDAGVSSKEEYEAANTAYQNAIENLNSATENVLIVKEGISKQNAQYSNTLIRATVSGMVLDVPVKVGNSVIQTNNFNDGTTIASIADMTDLIFKGNVDETEVGKIAVGNEINLIIGALQDEKLKAELEYISPKGTLSNGATLFEIRAAVKIDDDNETLIRSGYSANGEIVLERREQVLALPESSVEFVADSTFIYVLDSASPEDAKVYTRKAVELGLSDGIFVELLSKVDTNSLIRGKVKVEAKFGPAM
ncbi:efflux RND transporter periplasmic adaptor subunit [Bacteroidales bacterium OttesenSCG-928-B11]|nr:efflux RND transporter periplasmic adaptor subunit [Bacteroidales bacterium OttesenSCG-928-E04]MDL2308452.1 efflux RND transporter periplasmic adaptor subunit [Bacteroidales bacterium OttesenSCG-928-C03]MDL2311317.1 efflux RND transporter periplasmic adaptor subunit [Bacteroidales bacterium OttesenSCG-928-B11]MDL2326043.1 efflux RND transporter periplasmic adaptor subunit [Bacteroidales bacterium OttesenSCG-928-A14]